MKIAEFANSVQVDSDEGGHNESFHIGIYRTLLAL